MKNLALILLVLFLSQTSLAQDFDFFALAKIGEEKLTALAKDGGLVLYGETIQAKNIELLHVSMRQYPDRDVIEWHLHANLIEPIAPEPDLLETEFKTVAIDVAFHIDWKLKSIVGRFGYPITNK